MNMDLIRYSGEVVDLAEYSRMIAIMVAGGKMYLGDDHQDCFEQYCEDIGVSSGFDWSDPDFDKVFAEAVEKTAALFEDENEDIYGFDVFEREDTRYLTAHFPSNMEACFELLKEFAEEHGYILGSFWDFSVDSRWKIKIVDVDGTTRAIADRGREPFLDRVQEAEQMKLQQLNTGEHSSRAFGSEKER